MVWVQNQLELAPLGANIALSCDTEAYPPAIHFWTFPNGTAISSGRKYRIAEEPDSKMGTKVKLRIMRLTEDDFGDYVCVAKNSLGRQDGQIRLRGEQQPFMLSSCLLPVSTYFCTTLNSAICYPRFK